MLPELQQQAILSEWATTDGREPLSRRVWFINVINKGEVSGTFNVNNKGEVSVALCHCRNSRLSAL